MDTKIAHLMLSKVIFVVDKPWQQGSVKYKNVMALTSAKGNKNYAMKSLLGNEGK